MSTKISKSKCKEACDQASHTNMRQPSFYKITDFALPGESFASLQSPEPQSSFSADNQYNHDLQRFYSLPKASSMYLDKETRRKLSLQSSVDSFNVGSAPQTPDLKHWSTSSVSSWESEKDHLASIGLDEVPDQEQGSAFEGHSSSMKVPDLDSNSTSNRRRGSLKRQQNIDVEDASEGISSSANLTVNLSNSPADQGDSFEMEEVSYNSN